MYMRNALSNEQPRFTKIVKEIQEMTACLLKSLKIKYLLFLHVTRVFFNFLLMGVP